MNYYFLTTVLPSGKSSGSEIASQAFIDALRAGGNTVTSVGYMRDSARSNPSPEELCVGRRPIETAEAKWRALYWLLLGLLRRSPYSMTKYESKEYTATVKRLSQQQEDAIFIIDHAQLGWLAEAIPRGRKIIMIAHNVEQQIYSELAQGSHNSLRKWLFIREATLIARVEAALAKRADQVWCLTKADGDHFRKMGVSVHHLPPPSTFAYPSNRTKTNTCDIGLLGTWSWKPNHEGLQWFFTEVYPYLPQGVSIQVAGKGADWLVGKHPNVDYRGFIPDAQSFMSSAKVMAIPSRAGGGIQIKTLDAIASGSLIVATSNALRGLEAWPGNVLVSNDGPGFAEAIRRQLAHPRRDEAVKEAGNWTEDRKRVFEARIQEAIQSLNVSPEKTP